MKPVQIEFLMVDHLSARLDKAVGKKIGRAHV